MRRLAAEDSSIDIIGHGRRLDAGVRRGQLDPAVSRRTCAPRSRRNTLAGPLQTATYENKLYGAPFNTNTQILWYRKDLVKTPPETWDGDDRGRQARSAATHGKIEVQARAVRGLHRVVQLAVASAGGQILKGQEKADARARRPSRPLTVMRDARDAPRRPTRRSRTQMEDQGVVALPAGKAAFMVNYPFFYAQIKKERPEGLREHRARALAAGRGRAALASRRSAASTSASRPSRSTRRRRFAAATCLRSKTNQRCAAIKGGLRPRARDALDEQKIKEGLPVRGADQGDAHRRRRRARCSPAYNDISLAIQKTISHPPKSNRPGGQAERDSKDRRSRRRCDSGGLL